MPLVKKILEDGILKALEGAANIESDAGTARLMLSRRLAAVIHAYVSDAYVRPGIPVSTTGSATAQTGVTTAIGRLE